MATGASNADLAILLVDARKGLLTQTRRHAIIVSLLGIRHVVLAVNKIDLVDYDESDLPRHRHRLTASSPSRSASARIDRHPDLGALRRQRLVAQRAHALVSGAASARSSRARRGRGGPPRARRSACRCNGSTGRTSISAALPARSPAGASSAGRAIVVAGIRPSEQGRPHSRRRAAMSTSAEAGDAVTLTLADEIDIARGDMLGASRRAGPRSPTSSPRM